MSGEVEVDETFIGGKSRFMHKAKRAAKITGTGGMNKSAVMGLLERHGPNGHSRVKIKPVPNVRRRMPKVSEGDQFHNFDSLIRKLVTVSKKELDKRVAVFKRRKQGRKAKPTP